MTKNNYIQPAVEVVAINTTYTICAVSVNAPLSNGGGTDTIDPQDGL